MRRLFAIGIVLLFVSTTIVIGSSQQSISPVYSQKETNEIYTESSENAFTLPVFVSAVPKVFLTRKPVFIIVYFPMFLVDGYLTFDFDDGNYQTVQSTVAKHLFYESGVYQVSVEFDTTLGFKATGRTRVFII